METWATLTDVSVLTFDNHTRTKREGKWLSALNARVKYGAVHQLASVVSEHLDATGRDVALACSQANAATRQMC